MNTIRTAVLSDLKAIADLHILCFPDSFSTSLGSYLLKEYYKEYLKTVSELFFVAEDENSEIIGICMGYYCNDCDFVKRYIRKHFLGISFKSLQLLILGNKSILKKIKNTFSKKHMPSTRIINNSFKNTEISKTGDLLSICVRPQNRGDGTAQSLINAFLDALKDKNLEMCTLTVEIQNKRASHFYEKNGFVLYMQSDIKKTYAKFL